MPNKGVSNEVYLTSLGDARTARHASEEYHASPEPREASTAISDIRRDVSKVFQDATGELTIESQELANLKDTYWRRAARVGTESGAIKGYELEDYMRVGKARSYEEIKELIERTYPEGAIARHVIDGIDAYHHALAINPAHAATVMMEMIGRHLGAIEARAEELGGADNPKMVQRAFGDFITEAVPSHINYVTENFGTGDEAIHAKMYAKPFYPTADAETDQVNRLVLSVADAKGLIRAYDIQSRPYDQASLKLGNDIAQMAPMQAAMIRVQEDLVAMSAQYLNIHPERAAGNLENFSEIFVPEYADDGSISELLPNPKLLRAMTNNIMPGVALALHRRDGTLESMTTADINEGIRIAQEEYRLFQTRIGQFDNYDPESDTTELLSTYRVVCPANNIFPKFLTEKLANYFEDELQLVRTKS